MPSADLSFSFSNDSLDQIVCDVIIAGVFQNGETWESSGLMEELDRLASCATVMKEEKFDASRDKTILIRTAQTSLHSKRLIIAGLGKKEKITTRNLSRALRPAIDQALGFDAVGTIAICLSEMPPAVDSILSAVDMSHDVCYASRESKKPPKSCNQIILMSRYGLSGTEGHLKAAVTIARARSSAKDLTNMPPNIKRTTTLVEKAKSLSSIPNVTVDIVEDRAWIEKEMPCFFTVARGSLATDPPKFIRAHYTPGGAKKKIAIVGKSVIFDTGGYQVKTDDYMNTMKADMTGGAMALSLIEGFAGLGLDRIALSVYCAATPNMIDSEAMLPDSIVATTCGKKVEIRHTDAEGRLTLIDAVAKACEDKPDLIITIATLTGSAARAVGEAIALMGNETRYRERLALCAEKSGDACQTLDIWEDDYEDIKSKLDGADIINTSQNKNRGAQSACAFVMSGLTMEVPMLHLDIAGADMTKDEKATGIGVRSLMRFLIEENAAP